MWWQDLNWNPGLLIPSLALAQRFSSPNVAFWSLQALGGEMGARAHPSVVIFQKQGQLPPEPRLACWALGERCFTPGC